MMVTLGNNTTSPDSSRGEPIVIPLFGVILLAFGALLILTYTYCFFCVPSTNKRKIYAMMREAKVEEEIH